ncbi:MAG: hypothetical protein U1G05_04390 [Kiritimatiellia bacterium]
MALDDWNADIAVDPVGGGSVALMYAPDLTARLVAVDKRTGRHRGDRRPGRDRTWRGCPSPSTGRCTPPRGQGPAHAFYDIDLDRRRLQPAPVGQRGPGGLAYHRQRGRSWPDWLDRWADGFRDVEEPVVTMLDGGCGNSLDDSIVRTAFSNESGDYFFVVPEGSYVVEFVPPAQHGVYLPACDARRLRFRSRPRGRPDRTITTGSNGDTAGAGRRVPPVRGVHLRTRDRDRQRRTATTAWTECCCGRASPTARRSSGMARW